jgi:hypothetical protein
MIGLAEVSLLRWQSCSGHTWDAFVAYRADGMFM